MIYTGKGIIKKIVTIQHRAESVGQRGKTAIFSKN